MFINCKCHLTTITWKGPESETWHRAVLTTISQLIETNID